LGPLSLTRYLEKYSNDGSLLFVAFFLLGNLPDELFFEMGVTPTAGVKLAMMSLLLSLIGFVFTPIMSFVSRHNEYRADEFGLKYGRKREFSISPNKIGR